MPLAWAIHRLSGIATPASSLSSATELSSQLVSSNAKAIFTSPALLQTALKATRATKIPDSHVFIIEPTETTPRTVHSQPFKSVQDLVNLGRTLPLVVQSRWQDSRQNQEQLAFLAFSSGTSGSPVSQIPWPSNVKVPLTNHAMTQKGVMLSHKCVIANIIQCSRANQVPDSVPRRKCLCVLPQSHIYSLVVICQAEIYAGSEVVIFPSFQLDVVLSAIQRLKLTTLFLV